MGGVDEEVINALMENSRVSFSEIGRKLNLSEGAIRKRVNNLVKKKVIKQFTIETTDNHNAIIGVKTDPQVSTSSIVENLKLFKVGKIFETTGRFDVICFVKSKGMDKINPTLEKIRAIEGVVGTETFTVLTEN